MTGTTVSVFVLGKVHISYRFLHRREHQIQHLCLAYINQQKFLYFNPTVEQQKTNVEVSRILRNKSFCCAHTTQQKFLMQFLSWLMYARHNC